MSLPSTVVTLFRNLRADRYVDTVTIRDLTSKGTFNRATKQLDTPSDSVVYTGGALIRPAGSGVTDRGETGEALHDLDVYVPHDTHGVTPGNLVTVDAIHAQGDADLTGEVLTVQTVEHDSYDTHKMLKCKLSEGGGDRG